MFKIASNLFFYSEGTVFNSVPVYDQTVIHICTYLVYLLGQLRVCHKATAVFEKIFFSLLKSAELHLEFHSMTSKTPSEITTCLSFIHAIHILVYILGSVW